MINLHVLLEIVTVHIPLPVIYFATLLVHLISNIYGRKNKHACESKGRGRRSFFRPTTALKNPCRVQRIRRIRKERGERGNEHNKGS